MSLTLGPRAVERPADAGHTLVGTLDDSTPARLDRGGSLQPHEATFSIDWWVGGDDRWYFPSKEPSVRQRRLGAGPVIETAVRIPSGDAVHRVYPVAMGGVTATVIEVENDSPVPVALALAVRPYGLDGTPSHQPVAITDRQVIVGERVALCLPRRANERLATNRELADMVSSGQALSGTAESTGEHPNGVVLYPLPHRTTLRFVVPSGPGTVDPSTVPDLDAVQRGWTSVVEGGGRIELPDNGLTSRAAAVRARLLIDTGSLAEEVAALGSGPVLQALAESGAGSVGSGESVRVPLLSLASAHSVARLGRKADMTEVAALVAAVGRTLAILDDEMLAEELLDLLAGLTRAIEKSGEGRSTPSLTGSAFDGLAWALVTAGQPDPATDLFARSASVGAAPVGAPLGLREVTAASEAAGESGAYKDDDLEWAARFWLGTRRMAVVERADGLDLLPTFPAAWRGGGAEAHRLATTHGRVSFAIRWHGYRPALLWDVEPHARSVGDGSFHLRCPALDPEWSTTDPRGETLLAGSEVELPAPPAQGESFA